MTLRHDSVNKQDFQNREERIVDALHIVFEGIISQVKQVAETVLNLDEQ